VIADELTIDQLRKDTTEKKEWNALRQLRDVACLPGIVGEALALPDVHPGYGFPIGGVAAFDADEGVVVVGGVGFDINCGVRLLATPLDRAALTSRADDVARGLFDTVPAGIGSEGNLRLPMSEIDELLEQGAPYVIERGYGVAEDIEFTEENGRIEGADPDAVSTVAKQRQFRQVGTLGAGNHYLEVQEVQQILDREAAAAYGLREGQIVISIHTGSRALGHQIGQDYLKVMEEASRKYDIPVHERELVCAPITSPEGSRYLSAIACGANCAFANRQVITHLVRSVLHRIFGMTPSSVRTIYDIGHNNARFEEHTIDGEMRRLLVHRKGSTRAFGPGRKESPAAYRNVGHPTLVGGTMGTASYVMRGTDLGMTKTFGSGIHGAGRALSRKKAAKKYWGEEIKSNLAARGIILRAHSTRGIAEEAPGAYKDVERVMEAAFVSGINVPVARLVPIIVIKG
ncbi:MAG TPA: RtcB family protein, partial [Candidatus Acetothermia bacterium]|nr:RtcB family protein [Candidatus Acetothermia bacterium]